MFKGLFDTYLRNIGAASSRKDAWEQVCAASSDPDISATERRRVLQHFQDCWPAPKEATE